MYWFTTIRSYYQKNLFKVEIQNDAYPKYSLITRGDAYLSRIQTTHWGKEHDDQNYDGMEKVYLITTILSESDNVKKIISSQSYEEFIDSIVNSIK